MQPGDHTPNYTSLTDVTDDHALDFRGNNIANEQGEQWAEKVKSRLGSAYAVDFERFPDDPARDHLHVAKRRS